MFCGLTSLWQQGSASTTERPTKSTMAVYALEPVVQLPLLRSTRAAPCPPTDVAAACSCRAPCAAAMDNPLRATDHMCRHALPPPPSTAPPPHHNRDAAGSRTCGVACTPCPPPVATMGTAEAHASAGGGPMTPTAAAVGPPPVTAYLSTGNAWRRNWAHPCGRCGRSGWPSERTWKPRGGLPPGRRSWGCRWE